MSLNFSWKSQLMWYLVDFVVGRSIIVARPLEMNAHRETQALLLKSTQRKFYTNIIIFATIFYINWFCVNQSKFFLGQWHACNICMCKFACSIVTPPKRENAEGDPWLVGYATSNNVLPLVSINNLFLGEYICSLYRGEFCPKKA